MTGIYILIGILIGFMSGLFGIGGSIIGTPILKLFFGLPDLIAIASPLPVTIPTALAGVYGYWRSGAIHKKLAAATIIGGLPATILGALGTRIIASKWLMILTGVFVIIVGLRLLKSSKPIKIEFNRQIHISLLAGLIGFFVGILSGLLAVGGGIIMVPAFILIFGLSMQEAAATSLLCIAFFAVPGTLVHWWLGNIDWHLVLFLSVGVIPASYLGSKAALFIKSKLLKMVFSIFLICFGVYFILNQAHILYIVSLLERF